MNAEDDEMGWIRKNISVICAAGTLLAIIAAQAMAWQAMGSSIQQLQTGQSDIQVKVDSLPPPEWRWRIESSEKKIDALTQLVDESRIDRAEIKSELREVKTILTRLEKRM